MILIADSGSTKTDWCVYNGTKDYTIINTQGINPYHQSVENIQEIISVEFIPRIAEINPESVSHIYFYGAGCATEVKCSIIRDILAEHFTKAEISIASDLLGAARALCSNHEGIACVIGTGSNSCLYDGKNIVDNIPSLGYILGDEGSSVALGRRLLSDCFKRQLPAAVCDEFMAEYNLTMESILDSIYKKPLANRYMAQFTPFISKHREVPQVHDILISCFTDFFKRNVIAYHKPWLPVHFVGSVATIFSEELKETAESLGMKAGKFIQNPIEGIVAYHTEILSE